MYGIAQKIFSALPAAAQNISEGLEVAPPAGGAAPLPAAQHTAAETLPYIVDALAAIFSVLAILGILYGLFVWMASGGEDPVIAKGRSILVKSFFFFIVLIVLYTIYVILRAA